MHYLSDQEQEKLAIELWKKVTRSWIQRGLNGDEGEKQDDNYRDLVVRPKLNQLLYKYLINKTIFIDIGCGDGRETILTKKYWEKSNVYPSKIYGFDTNENLINVALKKRSNIHFEAGNTKDLIEKYKITNQAQLVTMQFVLHDTKFHKELIEDCYSSLMDKGYCITVIVNPQFTNSLLKKGLPLYYYESEEIFLGYPIVWSQKEPFYLPHFHRSLSVYLKEFEKAGFILEDIHLLKPSTHLLKKSTEEKISPLYNHEGNIYWPQISIIPSSVILVHKKLAFNLTKTLDLVRTLPPHPT